MRVSTHAVVRGAELGQPARDDSSPFVEQTSFAHDSEKMGNGGYGPKSTHVNL